MAFKILNFIISDEFNLIYCFGIFLFFIYNLIYLRRKILGINRNIKKCIEILPKKYPNQKIEFKNRFKEIIDPEISKNPALGELWHKFKDTLIPPVNFDEKAEGVYINTLSPKSFFTISNILEDRVDIVNVESIPGKLIGLGILGTFLGLAFGVVFTLNYGGFGGSKPPDVSVISNAIFNLLQSASFAFMAPFVGLFCSLIYSTYEKKIISSYRKLISEFNKSLEKCMIFKTKEQVAIKSLRELKKQSGYLKGFNEQLAISLGDVLGSAFDRTIMPHFEKISESILSSSKIQNQQSEISFREALEKMSGGMSSFANEQMDTFKEVFTGFQTTLPMLLESLKFSQAEMKSSASNTIDQIHENQQKINNQVISLFESLKLDFNGISKDIKNQLTETSDAANFQFKTSIENICVNLTNLSQDFYNQQNKSKDSFDEVINRFTNSSKNWMQNLEQVGQITGNLDNFIMDIKTLLPEIIKTLEKNEQIGKNYSESTKNLEFLSITLDGLRNDINNFHSKLAANLDILFKTQQKTAELWQGYEFRFGNIDKNASKWFEVIKEGIESYNSQINQHMEKILESSRNVTGSFATAVDELKEAIEDLDSKKSGN